MTGFLNTLMLCTLIPQDMHWPLFRARSSRCSLPNTIPFFPNMGIPFFESMSSLCMFAQKLSLLSLYSNFVEKIYSNNWIQHPGALLCLSDSKWNAWLPQTVQPIGGLDVKKDFRKRILSMASEVGRWLADSKDRRATYDSVDSRCCLYDFRW